MRMELSGPRGVEGAKPIRGKKIEGTPAAGKATPAQRGDVVEISELAKFMEELSRLPEIRQEKVGQLRQLIQKGEYTTAERLDAAVERLLADLRGLPPPV